MPTRGLSCRSPQIRLTTLPPTAATWETARCASRPLCYVAAVVLVAIVALVASGDGAGTAEMGNPTNGRGAAGGFRIAGDNRGYGGIDAGLDSGKEGGGLLGKEDTAWGGDGPDWERIDRAYGAPVARDEPKLLDAQGLDRPSSSSSSSSSASSSDSATVALADETTGAGVATTTDNAHGDVGPERVVPSSDKVSSSSDKTAPLFHQVFTTGDQYLSTINMRSMESIFYIYPKARLHLYYNQGTTFSKKNPRLKPLLKKGYNITFMPYNPKDTLEAAVRISAGHKEEVDKDLANSFIGNLGVLSKEKFWFSNEANLLRLCLLFAVGGTYLDTDVVLVKPLDGIDDAVAAGKGGKSIHCAVLRFTKPGNRYLSAAINNFLSNYDGNKWGNNGPSAFRRTVEQHPDLVCKGEVGAGREATAVGKGRPNCWLNILSAETFAPVKWRDWEKVCSKPGSSPVGSDAEELMKSSFAVHLNNQVTGPLLKDVGYVKGSLCDLVLSNFCSVCS